MSRRGVIGLGCVAVIVAGLTGVAPAGAPAVGAAGGSPVQPWGMFGHDALHTGAVTDSEVTSLTAPKLRVAWARMVGTTAKPVSASPVVAFNPTLGKTLVYDINAAGGVVAFDAVTGNTVWQTTVPWGIVGPDQAQQDVSTPTVDGTTLYFGTSGALVAMDATTGAIDCSFPIPVQAPATQPGVIDSSPVVGNFDPSGPLVFFGDKGQSEPYNGGHEWAITGVGNTAGACKLAWTFTGWQKQTPPTKLVGSWSSPALVQNASGRWLLVFGSSDPDDAVYALDAGTGTVVWRFQTPPLGPDHDVGAGPTISPPGANGFANGVVYVVGKDMVQFAIDLSTGTQLWSFDIGKDTGVSVDAVSSGALNGNVLAVPYAQWVYGFDATTGAVLWRTDVGGGIFYSSASVSAPAPGTAGDPVLVVGSTSKNVFAFDTVDGSLLATVPVGSAIFSAAAVFGPRVYEADAAGKVVALTVKAPVPTVGLLGSPVAGTNTYGVTLTVPAPGAAPAGTVTVNDTGGKSCVVGLTGSGTTYGGSCTISAQSAGQKVSASFAGDTTYAAATSLRTLLVRAPVPTVTSVSPASGPIRGGTVVTITGSGFGTGASVTFGTVRATGMHFVNADQITVVTPREAAGTVGVRVATAGGTTAPGPAATFTYDPGLT
jgi:outer membrane protein assembly factor BamB